MKFQSQLLQVAIATPFARSEDGKTSDGIAQGTGPQLAPNAIMYASRNATLTQP